MSKTIEELLHEALTLCDQAMEIAKARHQNDEDDDSEVSGIQVDEIRRGRDHILQAWDAESAVDYQQGRRGGGVCHSVGATFELRAHAHGMVQLNMTKVYMPAMMSWPVHLERAEREIGRWIVAQVLATFERTDDGRGWLLRVATPRE